jgi:two-component system response regulator YesN
MSQERYRVLLVDDEPSFLKMMTKVVPWEELGYQVVGTAADGEEAMEVIRKTFPHVVVTDIRMPGMDGLELIRTCWEEIGTTTRFIIVSGHDDFQYARKAIHYHVRNYLLKPLDVQELVGQMAQTARELQAEASLEVAQRQSKREQLEMAFRKSVMGQGKELEQNQQESLQAFLNNGGYLMMILTEQDSVDPDEQLLAGQRAWIRNALTDMLGDEAAWLAFSDEPDRLLLLLPVDVLERRAVGLGTFMRLLSQELMLHANLKTSLLASERVDRVTALSDSYEQVFALMNRRLFEGKGLVRVFRKEDRIVTSYDMGGAVPPQQILDHIIENDLQALEVDLEKSFAHFAENKVDVPLIIGYAHAVGYQLVRQVNAHHGDVSEWLNSGVSFPEYRKGMTLKELQQALTRFCQDAVAYIRQLRSEGTATVVDEVSAYARLHYRENLSLRAMAQRFYINPTYLGQRFRAETGTGFTEFLQSLRMAEAKRLLAETEEKVEAVALAVGYRDKNYFTAVFHEAAGMPPSQYRYRCRSGEQET